jgi:cobalamin synthase
MMNSFLSALQFLTIVPVRAKKSALAKSAIFFPIVGALLGLSAAAVVSVARH